MRFSKAARLLAQLEAASKKESMGHDTRAGDGAAGQSAAATFLSFPKKVGVAAA